MEFLNISAKYRDSVRIDNFDLEQLIPQEKLFQLFTWEPLEDVPLVTWRPNTNLISYGTLTNHVSWSNVAITIMVGIFPIIVGRYLWRKQHLFKYYFGEGSTESPGTQSDKRIDHPQSQNVSPVILDTPPQVEADAV